MAPNPASSSHPLTISPFVIRPWFLPRSARTVSDHASFGCHYRMAGGRLRGDAVACGRGGPAAANPAPSPEAVRFFEAKVRPVLVDNCFQCHGENKAGRQSAARLPGRDHRGRRSRAGRRARQAGREPADSGGEAFARFVDAAEKTIAERADRRSDAVGQIGSRLAGRRQAGRRRRRERECRSRRRTVPIGRSSR